MSVEVIGIVFIIVLMIVGLTILNSIDNSLCELVNDKRLTDAAKRMCGNSKPEIQKYLPEGEV